MLLAWVRVRALECLSSIVERLCSILKYYGVVLIFLFNLVAGHYYLPLVVVYNQLNYAFGHALVLETQNRP